VLARLTDKTYAHLIDQLSSKSSEPLNPGLREDVLKFYADMNAPIATRKDAKAWRQLRDELQRLKDRVAAPPAQPAAQSQ
jgi:hypothetical protein